MAEPNVISGFLPMDKEGHCLNPCSQEKIIAPWSEAVAGLRAVYLSKLGNNIHSVYLRGSVPQGKALKAISDLDSFAIVRIPVPDAELFWLKKAQAELVSQFPFVVNFEFQFYPLQETLQSQGYLSVRFLIKCLSLCIAGEDLAPQIPPMKPSLRLAQAFYGNIAAVLSHVLNRLEIVSQWTEIKQGCSFIMKRLIRTGFGLVMEQEGKFTRDLYLCYHVFSKYYPEKEKEMHQALEWAVEPIGDKSLLVAFLESFGKWLVREAENKYQSIKRP